MQRSNLILVVQAIVYAIFFFVFQSETFEKIISHALYFGKTQTHKNH